MKEIFIKADSFHIKIVTNCDFVNEYIIQNLNEFDRLTINFKLEEECNEIDAILQYNDVKKYNFNYIDNKYIFECPWNEIDNSTIFPMIFRYIVEIMRQHNDEIKVHASSIKKDKYSALFFAPSEGGKTTTAMAMCQKYQCALKSNDATVVKFLDKKLYLLRGDNIFKVRANGLKKYSKEIYEKSILAPSDTPWLDKARIKPEDIGVKIDKNSSEVKYIFFIKLDTLINGCIVKKYNKGNIKQQDDWFKPKMQIYQNISGTIKGSDLIPIGNDGRILPLYLPSMDNEKLALNRIEFINNLFDKCEVYQLRGQLDKMTKIINEIISNK